MQLKPRNPLVAATKFRRAGCHGKSAKAQRRAEKMEVLRLSSSRKNGGRDQDVFLTI